MGSPTGGAPRARRVDGGAAEARGQGGPVEPALPPARRLRRGRLARTVAGAYDALLAALPDDAAAKLLLCSIWVSGGALFPRSSSTSSAKPAKALRRAPRAALREAAPVVRFVHQQARDAVERRWLGKKGAKRDAHAVLFRYFAALRRRRRAQVLSRLPAHAVGAGDAAAAKRYLCAVAYGERKCAAGLAGDLARDYEAAARVSKARSRFPETARAKRRPGPGPLGRGPLGAAGAERATHVRAAARVVRRAHDEKINAVDAVEACVATAGDDGRVALYDATTGTVARASSPRGDAAKVVRLFRQDELWALTRSPAATAPSRASSAARTGRSSSPTSAASSAFDAKGEAVLWTAPKLESGGHDAITSLALDADGARVACGAYRWLHVLDATTGASLAALPFGDWVNACAWGAKDLVIFAGDAAAVVVMDLAGRRRRC
ncbi:hypothetical protein JL721_1730 [Aureococcus anophagefferens]|nr:hypothetical protein JL721_1730 [Aureococcus anophagefferens]